MTEGSTGWDGANFSRKNSGGISRSVASELQQGPHVDSSWGANTPAPISSVSTWGPAVREPQKTIEINRRAGSAAVSHGWKIVLRYDDPDWTWEVSSEGSEVQDGTNGALLDLTDASTEWLDYNVSRFDLGTIFDEDKYIYLKAAVDQTTLALSDWVFEASFTALDEVEFDTDPPYNQIFTRFYIGFITFTPGDPMADPVVPDSGRISKQVAKTPQMIVRIFLNGKLCKGFQTI